MSDMQPPTYVPPPVIPPPPTPAPAPSPSGPPPLGQGGPKRKTGLIIAIIVAVLLLCCCISTTVALLLFYRAGDPATDTREAPISSQAVPDEDERVQKWLDWDPESPVMLEAAPASLDQYVNESVSIIAPGFDVEDAVWLPGEYAAEDDWYYADSVYVRATHPASSQVSAAVEMWIQSDQMLAEDVAFEPEEGDIVTTIDGGSRQLLYVGQWGPAGFQLSSDREIALWKQIGLDWADAVVTDATAQGDQFAVSITKWDAYAIDGDYPVVSVTYAQEAGSWVIVDWEYEYPEQAQNSSV